MHFPTWQDQGLFEDVVEQLQLLSFKGMQLFVILMVAFFFLFVYYCTFGFIVGAIAESSEGAQEPKLKNESASET